MKMSASPDDDESESRTKEYGVRGEAKSLKADQAECAVTTMSGERTDLSRKNAIKSTTRRRGERRRLVQAKHKNAMKCQLTRRGRKTFNLCSGCLHCHSIGFQLVYSIIHSELRHSCKH